MKVNKAVGRSKNMGVGVTKKMKIEGLLKEKVLLMKLLKSGGGDKCPPGPPVPPALFSLKHNLK